MTKLVITVDEHDFEVITDASLACRPAFRIQVDGVELRVLVPDLNGHLEGLHSLLIDDRPYEMVFDRNMHWIKDYAGTHTIKIREEEDLPRSRGRKGPVKAPIPGQIAQVLVSAGQPVHPGQTLVILEAMKMRNEIRAQAAGLVAAVHVSPGQTISRGDLLVEIE